MEQFRLFFNNNQKKQIKMLRYIWIGLIAGSSYAQQLPQFSQFHRNQAMMNPGATGAYDFLDVTLGTRYQWLGFSNDIQGNVAPRTAYFNAGMVLRKKDVVRSNPGLRVSSGPVRSPKVGTGRLKHAVGGQVIADEYGAFRNISFAGTYAIHIPLSKTVNMSLGVRAGMSNHSFLQDKAQVLSGITGGPADIAYDNFVANGFSRMFMDVSSGLFVYSERFFVGVSAFQITRDFVSIGSGLTNFNPVMHFDFSAGMILNINDDLTIMPALSAKYMSPTSPIVQLNAQLEYKEWLWFGLGYRHTDAVLGMVGMNINERFKIGYSFDYTTSRLNNFTSGGHELVLGIMIR
jgi:type IX secretion system PorP/SprF family membrane protein